METVPTSLPGLRGQSQAFIRHTERLIQIHTHTHTHTRTHTHIPQCHSKKPEIKISRNRIILSALRPQASPEIICLIESELDHEQMSISVFSSSISLL